MNPTDGQTTLPSFSAIEVGIQEEDGEFVARCPNPEVASDGRTPEQALANLREALELYFQAPDRKLDVT